MRNSVHSVNPLNSREGDVVSQSSSWIKEKSGRWMTPVLVNGKEPRLPCRPLGGTDKVEAQNFAEITENYGVYACRW